jgi:hypothetical protein
MYYNTPDGSAVQAYLDELYDELKTERDPYDWDDCWND